MNAPASLYSLVDSFIVALSAIDAETGEVPAETCAALEALTPAIAERLEACAAVVARFEAEAESNDALAKQYHAKSVARGKEAERLRAYMLEQMQRAGIPKTRGASHTVWIAKSTSVAVTCAPEALPAHYRRLVPATIAPDKKALKAALDAGETIAGVELETTERVQFR